MTTAKPPSSTAPRGIAVVDVGFTNAKVMLYGPGLDLRGERKMASPHHDGLHYREIDVDPVVAFAEAALRELDAETPVDAIVCSSHGACLVNLAADGRPALPVMDYTSEPPAAVVDAYRQVMPDFAESYSPLLPMALLPALQLFWQQKVLPEAFARINTIVPLMQYVPFRLGGRAVSDISALGCQTHLIDMRNGGPSSLAVRQGWAEKFAPRANAWDVIGHFTPPGFRGRGAVLAGVHDSNANFLRYLAAGQQRFTLLSTGTWIIGFDTGADMARVDPARDIVANKSVFGDTVACCRFFGGREFEIVSGGAPGEAATLACARMLVAQGTFALPSFTDSGGPMPGTAGKGRITGPAPQSAEERATLASLYCALMVSESLDAVSSSHSIIVDGPFSQNSVFLSALAALRPGQPVQASIARDGTAAGAACLALMPDGRLPHIAIDLRAVPPAELDLLTYRSTWRRLAG